MRITLLLFIACLGKSRLNPITNIGDFLGDLLYNI